VEKNKKVTIKSLTELDKKIIMSLTEDASITNIDLSKKVGVSPSVCLGRTNRLKKRGIIKKYIAIVDERKVGMSFIAFVAITLSKPKRSTFDKVVKHIQTLPNILECYNVSGDHDFLIKVVAKDALDFRSFVLDKLMNVDGIGKINTSVILNVEKRNFAVLKASEELSAEAADLAEDQEDE
jgi:Lrp/AsnC family transcriptional regulator